MCDLVDVPSFKTLLQMYCRDEKLEMPTMLRRYRAILVPAGQVVASPDSYYSAPFRQDNVFVSGNGSTKPWVCQLLVAFEFGSTNEVALVRFYEEMKASVAGIPQVRVLREGALNVINASSVLGRALMHPHPTRKGLYMLNDIVR